MEYHIQYYNDMTAKWAREQSDEDDESETFDTALEALERRDEIEGDYPNDGVNRGCRVADDNGDVIEYGRREVNPS